MFFAEVRTKTALWHRVSVVELSKGLSLSWLKSDKQGKMHPQSELVPRDNIVSVRRFVG